MKVHLSLFVLLLIIAAVFIYAAPEGPSTLTVAATSRRGPESTSNITALAGNVTRITIAGTSTTQSWQGYYGNVTGTIALNTAGGKMLYSWSLANPSGEIYATSASGVPKWGGINVTGNITCWNFSRGDSEAAYPSYAEVEGWNAQDGTEVNNIGTYGIPQNAMDSINNTFLRTSARAFPTFYVGNQVINGTSNRDECPSVALYNSTNASTYAGGEPTNGLPAAGGDFQEVILIDNTNLLLLYTAIIDYERDTFAFDGTMWDFQMIVPENGHGTDTSTRQYNFYVELE